MHSSAQRFIGIVTMSKIGLDKTFRKTMLIEGSQLSIKLAVMFYNDLSFRKPYLIR